MIARPLRWAGALEACNPLPGRRRRARRQGRRVPRHSRRRRPGRAGGVLRPRGRRRARVPRHHGDAREARDDRGSRAAPPTRCSCRSRSAAASARWRTPRRCSTRAPTRSRSTRPRCTPGVDRRARELGSQCVVLAIDAKARHCCRRRRPRRSVAGLGGLLRRRAHADRPRHRRVGARGASSAGRGRSCSRAWTATAPTTAMTSR